MSQGDIPNPSEEGLANGASAGSLPPLLAPHTLLKPLGSEVLWTHRKGLERQRGTGQPWDRLATQPGDKDIRKTQLLLCVSPLNPALCDLQQMGTSWCPDRTTPPPLQCRREATEKNQPAKPHSYPHPVSSRNELRRCDAGGTKPPTPLTTRDLVNQLRSGRHQRCFKTRAGQAHGRNTTRKRVFFVEKHFKTALINK